MASAGLLALEQRPSSLTAQPQATTAVLSAPAWGGCCWDGVAAHFHCHLAGEDGRSTGKFPVFPPQHSQHNP